MLVKLEILKIIILLSIAFANSKPMSNVDLENLLTEEVKIKFYL